MPEIFYFIFSVSLISQVFASLVFLTENRKPQAES